MAFNISNISLSDTTVLHLVNPGTGEYLYADEAEKEPLTIELYGKSSKQHRVWLASALRKQEAEQRSRKKSKTSDELMEENADFFATMTKAINNMEMDGLKLDSKEAYKKLYSAPALMWISEQIGEKLGSTESFLDK